MLTDDELAAMQATVNQTLPALAEISRPSAPVSDGAGGRTTIPAVVVASVPVRIAPEGSVTGRADSVNADRVENVNRWQLTFPVGTNVAPKDSVAVGARTFTVVASMAERSYGVSCRVSAVEVL